MNSLLAFSTMAGAGMLSAFIFDIFRASEKAAVKTVGGKRPLIKRLRSWGRPICDFLSVTASCVIFLFTAYFCAAGNLRSYILLGFLCGILIYAGLLTHITGNLVYGILRIIFKLCYWVLWRFPKKIILCLCRRKHRT